jgi:LacI family transcriptional regulator
MTVSPASATISGVARIAIFLPLTSDNYFTDLLLGVVQYANSHSPWRFDLAMAGDFSVDNLQSLGCDGVILAMWGESQEIAAVVRASGIPAVNVARLQADAFPQVAPDDKEVGRMVARLFLDRGYRHFGYCAATDWDLVENLFDRQRFDGFAEPIAAAGHSVSFCDCPANWGEFSQSHEPEQSPLSQWLARLPRPVAIMAPTDVRGRQVLLTASKAGLRVPEDAAVVAVDNDRVLCEVISPALSSVQLDGRKAGYEAAGLLDRLMHKRSPGPLPILVPPLRLVERRSSDVLALEDSEVAEAFRFITETSRRPTRVSDVAANVLISRRALERRFRRVLGRSVQEEIHRVHVQRAKQLLADEALSIARVADSSGFTSPRHLSVVFRRLVGIPPTAYRRNILAAQTPD